jgi:hypothetical protein
MTKGLFYLLVGIDQFGFAGERVEEKDVRTHLAAVAQP